MSCNMVSGRRTAQKRVTGGRWRRIVLGHVLEGGRSPRIPTSHGDSSPAEGRFNSFHLRGVHCPLDEVVQTDSAACVRPSPTHPPTSSMARFFHWALF